MFNRPFGITIDSSGNICISDESNNKMRKIVVTLPKIAGTPTQAGVYDVNLTLNDGNNTVEQNFQITVAKINDAPTDINLSSITIAENSTIGTTIGNFNTTDADNGDTHIYSFCGGTDDANFTISGSTLQSNSIFDYETKSSYSMCIRSKDDANVTYDKNITINITNSNDIPTITSIPTTDVNESSVYSYTLNGTDVDGDELNWSVTNLPSWLNLSFGNIDVTTIAGEGTDSFADGNATTAQFNKPTGIAVDNSGNIYVADYKNNKIRKIDSSLNVTTLAGSSFGFADGSGTNAQFKNPYSIALDSSGNVYVADTVNDKIRKIDSSGNVTTLAGSSSGFADGSGTNAQFNKPTGIAIDSSGNVYVADTVNHKIRKIDSSGNVTTFAGSSSGFADGSGTNAQFNNPKGISIDSSGNVYVADTLNHKIRKIDSSGHVTTVAGSSSGFADGNVTTAQFNLPQGVDVDNNGNIYVADSSNHKIRKIDNFGNVTTLAGSGTDGFADGNATTAKFNVPYAVTVDNNGNIYVVDESNNKIRKIVKSTILNGTPTNDDVGVHDVNLTVSDGENSVSHYFQITVVNV